MASDEEADMVAQESPTTAETARNSCAAQAPSVLVVGTNAHFLRTMVSAFEGSRLEVRVCATLAAAQEACRRFRFDLIILDWMVGRLFADELATLLQSTIRPRPLPPVGVLSGMDEADTRACLRPDAPIRGVLSRPAEPAEVVSWAEGLLKGEEVLESKGSNTC